MANRYGTMRRVVGVANKSPPITARASAAFCSSPGPPIAIGIMPTTIAAAVISTGRMRVWPASTAARNALLPLSCCSRANVTSRMEFAEATPTAMIAPISEGTLSVVPVMNSIVMMPQKVAGSARITTNGSPEILIVDDHEQIDKHCRKQQSDAQIPEGIAHALDLPEDLDHVAGLELLLQLADDLADVARNAAEIAALHVGIDVVHRLDIGLVQIGRNAVALQSRYIAQQPRYRWAVGSERSRYRRVTKLAERTHLVLRGLHCDVVGNPGCQIGPEIRRNLLR